MGFSVNFHHGGRFVRDWLITYKGGNETLKEGLYEDRWSYFEITGIVENDLNVKKPYKLWWMLDEEVNFRVIKVDDVVGDVKN